MTKYYEEEFEVSTQKNMKFKFKNINTLDILTMSNEFEMYAGTHDTKIYKNYIDEILTNTIVCINDKWYPVKEGGNFYPASLQLDIKGLREITNMFFTLVIKPVFQDSNESSTEQE